MKTYRLKVKPDIRYMAGEIPRLTQDMLVQSLAGVVVRELGETHYGERIVDVQLERPTDKDALDELTLVLRQLGFSLVEARLSQWVNQALARALGYAAGSLIVGTGISKKPAIGVASSVLTFLVVSAIETEAYKLLAEYEVGRDYAGSWTFRELQLRS